MRRRGFIKGLIAAAAAVMRPLQLTKFGNLEKTYERRFPSITYHATDIRMWRPMDKIPEYDTIMEYEPMTGITTKPGEVVAVDDFVGKASPTTCWCCREMVLDGARWKWECTCYADRLKEIP